MGIVNEKLLAEYGRASIDLEVAQAKFNAIKEEIVKVINAPNSEPNEEIKGDK